MCKRVIFIDDDPLFLRSMERYLKAIRLPWEMSFWSDEVEALEMLAEEISAVVVLDRDMPHIDGIDFLERARGREGRDPSHFHIIMLTGHNGFNSTVEAFEVGADDYLSKPVNMDELRSHVEHGLAKLSR